MDSYSRTSPSDQQIQPIQDRLWAMASAVGFFLVISFPIILSGNLSGRGASDDLKYHWVAIEQFADQLPNPDLSDYASATTPGYHLLLSPMVNAGLGHTGIQLVANLWTVGLIGLMGWVLGGRLGKSGVVLLLPMICSMYVLFSGVWLLPDNAGWLGVLAIVLLALNPKQGWKTWLLCGLILFGLVWLRQVHIWVAGVVWLGAWLGSASQTPEPGKLFTSLVDRIGRASIAIACTIPAMSALAWFVLMWGGLVPPTFQDMHQGPNLATPGFILTQLSILSVFFLPMLWPRLREVWKHQWAWVLLAAAIGCVLGVLPESTYSYDAGRYGGWWNLINKLPTAMDRSPMFVLGSIAGAVALVVWLSLASRRDALVWLGVLAGFVFAQSANHASWQRYHEPMLLMMIMLILARSSVIDQYTRRVMFGCVVLAMMLGALTISSMLSAKPMKTQTRQIAEPDPSLELHPFPSKITTSARKQAYKGSVSIAILGQSGGFVSR